MRQHDGPDPAGRGPAGGEPPTAAPTTRRAVLRGGLGVGASAAAGLLGAACGRGSTTEGTVPEAARRLVAQFPLDVPHVVTGSPVRLPFVVADGLGRPVRPEEASVLFSVEVDRQLVGPQATAPRRTDGVPVAYLAPSLTFPEPGTYDVVATVGGERLVVEVQAYARTDVGPPQVGEPLPPVDTPTDGRSLQVDPVCSRVPGCGLHRTSLAEAVGRGRPVVVVSASPVYGSDPDDRVMLDLVLEQVRRFPGATFVHSEVYRNPKDVRTLADAVPSPLTAAYRLRYTPTAYVTDAAGVVVARADATVDRVELAEMLAQGAEGPT